MRYLIISLCLLCGAATPAVAQVSGIGTQHVPISINLPGYPQIVQVPDYPVYYAPQLPSNYFFYDGMYWVYERDNWYASSWYNGPWSAVNRRYVPDYVLRVPVRYYRKPPQYFKGWARNEPPHWGDHWGREWGQQRSGWNHWNHKSMPRPAPLPSYQRQYSGDRYPQADHQRVLLQQNYRYQPSDPAVRQYYQKSAQQSQHVQKQQQQQKQQAHPQQGQGQGQPAPQAGKQGNGNGQDKAKGNGKDDGGNKGQSGR